MSINQSNHFRYGAFTISSLKIFDKVPVLETNISFYTKEVFFSTSLDESSIEFAFETNLNLYLDMFETHLNLKLQFFQINLCDALKKKKQSIKQNQRKSQMRNHKLTQLME